MISDFLFSLFSSLIFWLTIAGISFRAFKIDIITLEEKLKAIFNSADNHKISLLKLFLVITNWFIVVIYGNNRFREWFIVTTSTVVVFSFVLFNLENEWNQRKDIVNRNIKEAIEKVDNEYFNLLYSEHDEKVIIKAFKDGSSGRMIKYANNDPLSKSIRAIGKRFFSNFKRYIAENGLQRDFFFESNYGKSYSNPYTLGTANSNFFWNRTLTILIAIFINMIALNITLNFFEEISENKKISIKQVIYLAILSLLGQINMTLFAGETFTMITKLISFLLSLLPYFALCFLIYGIYMFMGDENKSNFHFVAFLIFALFMVIYGDIPKIFPSQLTSGNELLLDLKFFFTKISRETILIGMTTIFPLLLIISLFFVSLFLKFIHDLTKTIILGQIYGASTLSGGTFLAGYMTTIITSTTVLYFFLKILINRK